MIDRKLTMVYYYISGNVKILRNILIDYGATSEVSPYEYMKTYINKCPENIEDVKVTWIAKSFLSIQKHEQFLKSISSHLSQELSEEEQDYFMILFHAVIFQIDSKNMQFLYKCLFNLSKNLLNTFTKFLSNNEVLAFISHVAQSNYDTKYITENIIAPLFTWQPYISEMGHNYDEYVQKLELRKIKPKTIPIQPNVLNRKLREASLPPTRTPFPATPPNSLSFKNNRKMLTKSAIDQRLKRSHEKNKQKAANLLNSVKTAEYNFAQVKSENYNRKLSIIENEIENEFEKPLSKPKRKFIIKPNPVPVKETAATLKRMGKSVQSVQQDEVQWLSDLIKYCKGSGKVEQLIEYDRQETEKERLHDMERKHLEGQISYEEALIAKKKLVEDNKKRYEEFLKEKESWNENIENWKRIEMERNRKQIEKLSLLELNVRQAKEEVVEKKKILVEQLKKESDKKIAEAMKKKQEELERRINMIKEIKILAMIAKKAKFPKVIDLTETSGLGFLCEMSMAELQERLISMKLDLKEELECKKKLIKQEKMAAKEHLEQTKDSIKNFIAEHTSLKKEKEKPAIRLNNSMSTEINNLKKVLEEKKKLRIQLTS